MTSLIPGNLIDNFREKAEQINLQSPSKVRILFLYDRINTTTMPTIAWQLCLIFYSPDGPWRRNESRVAGHTVRNCKLRLMLWDIKGLADCHFQNVCYYIYYFSCNKNKHAEHVAFKRHTLDLTEFTVKTKSKVLNTCKMIIQHIFKEQQI